MPADRSEVTAFELVRVRVPMRRSRQAAHGTMPPERDVVLVRAIGSDGAEGWGECSALEAPTYTGEYTDAAWGVLRDLVVPLALAGGRNRGLGHPMASAAVDIAVTDLSLRRQGITLAAATGRGDPEAPGLAWTAVVGVQPTIDDLLVEVEEACGAGAASVKLKIQPGWDLEPVRAVRAAHPSLRVAVDANGSYGHAHLDHLMDLARLLVERRGYLEQPLVAEDLSGLRRLAARSPVRVALDESVVTATDAGVVGSVGANGLINVKPARLGGVSATLALTDLVAGQRAKRRPETFLGGMFETGVGRSAALAIGRACITRAETDLGPSAWYFDDDLTEPLVLASDQLHRGSTQPGLSLAPRPDRLAEVAVERLLLGGSSALAVHLEDVGSFRIDRWSGTAAELHGLDWPDPLVPTIWWLEVESPALVLGSAGRHRGVDVESLDRAGIAVVPRRSGGGAVLLEPGNGVWLDVLIPRHDPRWLDDVGRSFDWLGRAWAAALAQLGLEATVHPGPPDRHPLAAVVCFAGLGSGEVTVGGAKAVGLSQRRTRLGARFQSTCYRSWHPAPLAALGLDPDALPPVAVVDVEPTEVVRAVIQALAGPG